MRMKSWVLLLLLVLVLMIELLLYLIMPIEQRDQMDHLLDVCESWLLTFQMCSTHTPAMCAESAQNSDDALETGNIFSCIIACDEDRFGLPCFYWSEENENRNKQRSIWIMKNVHNFTVSNFRWCAQTTRSLIRCRWDDVWCVRADVRLWKEKRKKKQLGTISEPTINHIQFHIVRRKFHRLPSRTTQNEGVRGRDRERSKRPSRKKKWSSWERKNTFLSPIWLWCEFSMATMKSSLNFGFVFKKQNG